MRHLKALSGMLVLAACQNGDGNRQTGTGVDDNGAQVVSLRPGESARFVDGEAAFLHAGQWEAVMEVVADRRPNTSGSVAPQTRRLCLPTEQSQRPGVAFLLARERTDEACEYQHFSMEGGHVYATGHCGPEANRMYFIASGPFTPTRYELAVRAQAASGGVTFDNELRVTSRRTGDCPAG